MDEMFFDEPFSGPGFRLHKLEVYNWGTFDSTEGTVHTVRPAGRTSLLIGQNGSGKSTLVDALLTLLVKPVVRNYNVAAGARKQERDERTYIKGAYGRFSRDEDNAAEVQFLRPDGSHYAALLAYFCNEDSGEAFTVAQVLYLNSEGRAEKIYCFSSGERSIAGDLAGLTGTEKLRTELKKRGFRATTRYAEYHSWFARATGVRPKAMDMFNQTVAVKDIQSLNRFIREHMLEAKPWNEKVDQLLNHFTQLSEAHQSLVRVRRQSELLEPIAARGAEYRERAGRLETARRLLDAADSFFRSKTAELFAPQCEAWRAELERVRRHKRQLDADIQDAREECRRLKNEIEQAGGERLRQIPLLIESHQTRRDAKRDESGRFHQALRAAGIGETVTSENLFRAVHGRLPALLNELAGEIAGDENRRDERVIERGELARQLEDDEREFEALSGRRSNLPEAFAELRRSLCENCGLPEKDLPFAAELIAVRPEHRGWESSIELVLRSFALSLLVPQKHYRVVSGYVERTRLADERGRGRRLVYLRVGERSPGEKSSATNGESLIGKLDFREGHPLLPWVKAEIHQRFDYRCCESLEEFQAEQGPALTRQRHVKSRTVRHEKDDRERVADPRHFVLGWDNREKRRRLAEEIRRLRERREQLDSHIDRLGGRLSELRERQRAAGEAQQTAQFASIDYAAHEREIAALRLEQKTLEEQNDEIRMLRGRLAEAESRQAALEAARDQAVGNERELENKIADGERLVAAAREALRTREQDGTLARHAESFAELEAAAKGVGSLFPATVDIESVPLAEKDSRPRSAAHGESLTIENLFEREREFKDSRRTDAERLRREIEPLQAELLAAMTRFLREFPDERADLEARADYLDGFLELREQIDREDLPRHERRFKDRLNEKVTQEMGMLNAALQADCTEIGSRIEVLNESLRQLEYRPGTYMRLERRPVRDREIREFQDALKECLADTFEGTPEADEARYERIEKLISRLREEDRWRNKVTDVRRWFDFAARELDIETGAERGYYEDSTGQSGGEKAKLAFTILVAAIAYQYDIEPGRPQSDRFHFVVVDEMFSRVDDQYAEYALELFRRFGLQLLIVAPLDAKARVTEPYVGCYLHVMKDAQTNRSEIFSMTAREFEEAVVVAGEEPSRPPAADSMAWRRVPR